LQVYAFDVRHAESPPTLAYSCVRPHAQALEAAAAKDDRDGPFAQPWNNTALASEASLALRRRANEHVFNSGWNAALELYDKLLAAEPWLAQGYVYRAIILLKRGWRGDALAALRDADTCVALSPRWPKAYETRVRCLKELGQVRPVLHLWRSPVGMLA
jgi:tetratricopeptide (TPR) repeat protein